MSTQPVRLRVLLQQRHWQNHRTFCREYDKAARAVDSQLRGTAPSRAQLHRWLSGELKGLPYGDHCRILEKMFPEWSAAELFEPSPTDELSRPIHKAQISRDLPVTTSTHERLRLVKSGGELTAALLDVVRNSEECLVTVGSRSQAPTYLQEIELTLQKRPELIYYRILIGPLHSQLLKDHLLRLVRIRGPKIDRDAGATLHISIINDLTQYPERFFAVNEKSAVITLPSANSPMNFDTGLIISDPTYVNDLLHHGKALYGKHRLESMAAINELEVLG
jgi:hypothetical protein